MNNIHFAENAQIACICEGSVEVALIDLLLESDKLIFSRDNLISNAPLPPKYKKGKAFSEQYLGMNYGKKIHVIIIQDGDEKFKLTKTYLRKIEEPIIYIKTKPEIEMLLIHKLGFFDEYQKVKSNKKPSVFLQEKLKMKQQDLKSTKFIKQTYDGDSLVDAIELYHRKAKNKSESMKYILKK